MPKKIKRKLRLGRLILLIFLLSIFISLGAGLGFLAGVIKNMPNWNPGDIQWDMTTFIYDQNGNKIAERHGVENRIPVEFEQIPDTLKQAFLATEDPRFYEHFGLDLKALARAVVANIKDGWGSQGGSTITVQLAKNAFIENTDKKLERKIQEAILAIQLERTYVKDEIFEFYLNEIYFGEGAWGVQAAAKTYFGKNVQDLNLAESAMLAGLVQRPAAYSPFKHPEAAKKRRATVLDRMVRDGYITPEEAEAAKAEEFQLAPSRQERKEKYPYFVDYVIDEASRLLEKNGIDPAQLYKGGLRIYTTLDPKVQDQIEKVYADPENFPKPTDDTLVQSAMVVMDHRNGQIKGLIGGREYVTQRGLNRATDIKRQPGSAFKPLAAYGPAIEQGFGPGTVVDDVPRTYPSVPKPYTPKNYDNKYRGLITLRTAVQYSINVVAVNVLNTIGVDTGWQFAKRLGLPLTNQDRNLSIALGGLTTGVSPLEMAAAYGAFANQGVWNEPYAVTMIKDRQGNILVQNKPKQVPVMKVETAYLMTDILQTVVKSGTGWRAKLDRPVAGKTGTTQLPDTHKFRNISGNRDAWFAGYTPELVGVVWMGYDETTPEHYLHNIYGGSYPAIIWKKVMQEALKDVPVKDFPKPDTIVYASIDAKSGLLPSELTPQEFIVREAFTRDNLPTKVSDVWVEAEVCAESGQVPNEYCTDIVTGVFLKRPVPYTPPKGMEDVFPQDKVLELPTETCTIHGPDTPVAVKVCIDPRHFGQDVLALVPEQGQTGGCPAEMIVEQVFPASQVPTVTCDLPDHQLSGSSETGAPVSGDPGSEGAENQGEAKIKLKAELIPTPDSSSGIAVKLTWKPKGLGDNVIFSIDRQKESEGMMHLGATTTTSYTDLQVESGKYIYRITAHGLTSNSVEVIVP